MFLRGIDAFLAVVRLKTLKGASEHLHLAQSTVSKRLQLLEQECGFALFDRNKGGKEASLTPAGQRFISVAQRMRDLLNEAKGMTDEPGAHALIVGAVTSLHAVLTPHLFSAMLRKDPAMQLTGVTLHSAEVYEEIDRRSIDAGFTLMEKMHPNVTALPCFSEPMRVMRRDMGQQGWNGPVPLDSLDFSQNISFPWTPYYQVGHAQLASKGVPHIFVDDPTMLAELLQRPSQWAFVPLSMARYYQGQGAFQVAVPEPLPPSRTCYLATHKNPRGNTAESLKLLLGCLRETLEAVFGANAHTAVKIYEGGF